VASVQDLKRRIRSIRNTRKITKAMELVASARLRRAQARIEAMRPYADRMMELMTGTARASSSVRGLPLLQRRDDVQAVAILPLTGDRGLAGAFNAQVLRLAFALGRRLETEGVRVRWLVAGRKGASTIRFRRLDLLQAWTGFSDRPAYADAQALAHKVAELYVDGEVDRVVVVYNRFVSPLVQEVVEQDLLPIPEHVLEAGAEEEEDERRQGLLGDFIYEPEPDQILERLLPVYVETELYRALLESAASEQGARMTAMRNASKNAGELIDTLTLAMNRARQAEITQEILEVVAGADALTQ
jgi:F-type H+-transporting ATPase subunit gamma